MLGRITEEDLEEAAKLLPPAELKAQPGNYDFDMRGDARTLFEQVSKTLGLEVVFDKDYQPLNDIRYRVKELRYRDALRALEAATDSFITPISERLIFASRDTSQKRQQYARTAEVVIPVPDPVSVQEIQEIANTVRSILDIRRLMVDADKRLILVRDVVGKVRAAQIMIRNLMHSAPQVMVQCQLMEVSSTYQAHYGISFPTSFPLVDFGSPSHPNLIPTPIPSGYAAFLTFGGGITFIGIGLTQTTLFASLSKTFSSTLQSAEVLASEGQAATLKFGTKYPIVTNQYIGETSGSAQVFTPPPTVTFEDLGLVIKVTPYVHGADEVTLDIEASFRLLSGTALNNIPIIANREYKGTVRMVAGQSAVLTGLLTGNEAKKFTGLFGVSNIPLLGKLLRENMTENDRSETMIVIEPRIVIPGQESRSSRELWIGTESRPAETL